MNIYKRIGVGICILFSFNVLAASTSLNEMHSCLALVNFVDSKIATAAYEENDKSAIKKGLLDYSQYLDKDVINPKLLQMYGGNQAQATLMKRLFVRQQVKFTEYLNDRYAERKLKSDYAVAIRKCSVKTRTEGDVAHSLIQAIDIMENR